VASNQCEESIAKLARLSKRRWRCKPGYSQALDEFTARMTVAVEHCGLSGEDSGLTAHAGKGRKALGKTVATGVINGTAAEGCGCFKPAIEGGKQRVSSPVKLELVAR
jgi:hypothetical protein